MNNLPYWSLLLCLGPWCLLAQQPLPIDSTVRIDTLSNGLVYFIQANEQPEKRAELRLVVRAGSLQETDQQLGVAHFVEHMAFNGTTHFQANELVDFLERNGSRFGADINASTGFEQTIYQLTLRTDSQSILEDGLLILEDWAQGVTFDSTEIEKERGVVIAEWRSRLGYQDRLQNKTYPHLFENSRYANRLPIGSPELIDTVNRATVQAYYQDWYRPELMALIAVGDFDPDWIEKSIRTRFSRLKNPPQAPARKSYQLATEPRTLVLYATDPEAPYTNFRAGYELADLQPANNWVRLRQEFVFRLYNTLLNRRFVPLLEQTNPPFTFAGASYRRTLGNRRVFQFDMLTSPEQLPAALEAVTAEIARAEQHGFLASELERAKEELLDSYRSQLRELDRRRSSSYANSLVGNFLGHSYPIDLAKLVEGLQPLLATISLAELNLLAAHFRDSERRSFVLTGPETKRSTFPDSSRLVAQIDSLLSLARDPYEEKVLTNEIPVPNLVYQTVELIKTDTALGVEEFCLPNGIRIILYPTNHQKDEILMSAFRAGGTSLFPDSLYATFSEMMTVAGLSGLDTFSLSDLNILLSGKEIGANIGISELYDLAGGQSTQEDLESFFRLLYLKFTATTFDSVALRSYQRRMQAVLENRSANPLFAFAELQNRLKYGNHPRRQIRDASDYQAINLNVARQIVTDRFGDASDFCFIFVGNLPRERILELAGRYLGNLPATNRTNQWKDVGVTLRSEPLDTTFVGGLSPKGQAIVEWHGTFPYTDRTQRYAFSSLIDLMRLRLREELREEQSGVYGVSIRGFTNKEPNPNYRIRLNFNANPDEVTPLVARMDSTITAILAGEITESTVAKIQATQLQSFADARQRNSYWLNQIRARYQYQLPLAGLYPGAYEKLVNGLTAKLLQSAAQRYLAGGTRFQFIQLPESY